MDPLQFPAQTHWPDWLRERVQGSLERASGHLDRMRAGSPDSLSEWNDAQIQIGNAHAVSSLIGAVHPEAGVRELAEQLEAGVEAFVTDVGLDPTLFAALARVEQPADPGARRVLHDALRDFHRSGVDRDEDTRERVRALRRRATELSLAFGRNIRDGRRTVRIPQDALAGLPDDFVAGHTAGADGMVEISTDYTDTHPFLAFSTDAVARRTVMQSFLDLGWPANDAVLRELFETRHALATLLGYPDWPSYDAEVKMIGSGEAIAEFIDSISVPAGERGSGELAVLAEALGAPVDMTNSRHAMEQVRRKRFDVDSTQVRRYFDFTKVRRGLLDVTGRLFGLEYTPVEVATWHPDVTSYDVHLDGELLGRIHLDLHPRPGKYNHAAQFELVAGIDGRQLPEGVLVCNFPRGLMEHGDVETLFHEFGHLMHHTLAGRHRWADFSGVATEWDFVEAPSQMFEEWAWDAQVLRSFATDETGTPIPADLVTRMRAASEFGKGYLARTQMYYAAISYYFHLERPGDLTARMAQLCAQYCLLPLLENSHFHCGFGHLAEYSSAYYTYMWSETIAKDLFTAFDREDLFAPGPALSYRDKVLAPGGSADAADLVADFLGRPFNTEAFARWLAS